MSRKRSLRGSYRLVGWLSAKPDNAEKRFIQVGDSLLFSPAYQALHTGAKHLYLCMAMESGRSRYFTLPASAAKKYGVAERSFWNYVAELEALGFIKRRSGRFTREQNEYEFSFDWKNAHPGA